MKVGEKFEFGADYTLICKSKFVGKEKGPTASDLYHFLWNAPHGECRYSLTVDPTTNVVTSAKIDGDPTACQIVP